MRFLRLSLGRKAPAPDTELLLSDLTPRNGSQTMSPPSIATSGDEATHKEIVPFPPRKPLGGSQVAGASTLYCPSFWGPLF